MKKKRQKETLNERHKMFESMYGIYMILNRIIYNTHFYSSGAFSDIDPHLVNVCWHFSLTVFLITEWVHFITTHPSANASAN